MRILILIAILSCVACDPEGRENCDWVLEPEPKLANKVEPGYIPVCARNRVTMKQDCRMETTLEAAKRYYGRRFRYVDLKVKGAGIPRKITSIRFCQEKSK